MNQASRAKRRILLLGSTGSIGTSTCNCVRRFADRFTLCGLSANRNTDALAAQVSEFVPEAVCVGTAEGAAAVGSVLAPSVKVYSGPGGLEKIVAETDFDILLNALVGAVGFRPTLAALQRGKTVALANKESLVIGGDLIRSMLAQHKQARLVPVDSEHSAILQCINGEDRRSVESIILTASGGPFRALPPGQFRNITPARALDHPTWAMGRKITIDAATLMNKGFEAIEAHHLFDIDYDRLRVLVHPESIIHSMVEFHDGAVIAQCGLPDMELPIQYALSYPDRLPISGRRLDLAELGSLTFEKPDLERFPCLRLCLEAGQGGGTLPAVLNAANEVAVDLFLEERIRFDQIGQLVQRALEGHHSSPADCADVIELADREARQSALTIYQTLE